MESSHSDSRIPVFLKCASLPTFSAILSSNFYIRKRNLTVVSFNLGARLRTKALLTNVIYNIYGDEK